MAKEGIVRSCSNASCKSTEDGIIISAVLTTLGLENSHHGKGEIMIRDAKKIIFNVVGLSIPVIIRMDLIVFVLN